MLNGSVITFIASVSLLRLQRVCGLVHVIEVLYSKSGNVGYHETCISNLGCSAMCPLLSPKHSSNLNQPRGHKLKERLVNGKEKKEKH